MTISPISGFGAFNFSLNLSVRSRQQDGTALAGKALDTLRDLARRIVDSRGALQKVRDRSGVRTFRIGEHAQLSIARTESSAPLGLSLATTPTTMKSTEEVNNTPTSFTPFAPSIVGNSTTQPIIGGVYNGAQGNNTLHFDFRHSGTKNVGSQTVTVRIRKSNGQAVQTINFNSSYVPGTPVTLSNGLTLALTAGNAIRNDDFYVDVSSSTGSVVDPDKPLNGTLNNNPNLEYGQSVNAGSFYINGSQIDIVSGDSLNDVLAKITSSAADVTALFNSFTEEVELTRKTGGPTNEIILGTDNTGFFAATKLSGATQVLGLGPDPDRLITTVSPLSGISSGSFQINGVDFTVNTVTQSLNDIIGLINTSSAGVIASYDEVNDKFELASVTAGQAVTIANGTSNFFAGLGIAEGTFGEAVGGEQKLVHKFSGGPELPRLLEEFAQDLNRLFNVPVGGDTAGLARVATSQLRETITDAFERVFQGAGGDRLRTGLGIEFFFDQPEKGVVRIDKDRLGHATTNQLDLLIDFLTTDDGAKKKGLLPALDDALEEIGRSLIRYLDPVQSRGLIVDLRA